MIIFNVLGFTDLTWMGSVFIPTAGQRESEIHRSGPSRAVFFLGGCTGYRERKGVWPTLPDVWGLLALPNSGLLVILSFQFSQYSFILESRGSVLSCSTQSRRDLDPIRVGSTRAQKEMP